MTQNNLPTELVIVGGMGTRLQVPHMEALLGEAGYPVKCVEGVRGTYPDALEVASIRQQQEALADLFTKEKRPRVLISHCAGALAVVKTLETIAVEDVAEGGTWGVLIAPPLPDPIKVLEGRFVRGTIKEGKASVDNLLPVAGEPSTRASIPSDYYDEVRRDSPAFYDAVGRLLGKRGVKLVIPGRDWNKPGIEAAEPWRESENVLWLEDARHDLSEAGQSGVQLQHYREALQFALHRPAQEGSLD